MTVSSQVNRKDYSGNGSTTNFATEFRFLEDSHLRVILTVDSTGVEAVQSITTNYTVTGKGEDSGGTVTMIIAPATGETLTIKRDVPVTQQTDYVENDDFPAESHERALDKLTMIVQEQQEELDRSLKLSEGQQSSGLIIPAPNEGKFLQWDAFGNFINVDLLNQGLLIVTAFGQSLVESATGIRARIISAIKHEVTYFDGVDDIIIVTVNPVDNSVVFAGVLDGVLSTNSFLHIQDQKAPATAGGGFNSGSWITRTLNTELTNNISGASLSSDVITLPAGSYYIEAQSPANKVNRHATRILNSSDTDVLLSGTNTFATLNEELNTFAFVSGLFTISSTKTILLQHRCQTTKTSDGFGVQVNTSLSTPQEVYSEIKIWKVG